MANNPPKKCTTIKPDKHAIDLMVSARKTKKILEPGLWTTGYGPWIRNYGLHLENKERHEFFFIIAKLTHIFSHVYLNFLQVLHIVNSVKNY